MRIDRLALTRDRQRMPGKTAAFCALECRDCTGMCLALYMMLTPEERNAVWHLSHETDGAAARLH